jgi:hypothetical protein
LDNIPLGSQKTEYGLEVVTIPTTILTDYGLEKNNAKKRNLNGRLALYSIEMPSACSGGVAMIIFAAIVVLILIVIACTGLIFAFLNPDDLRNMGIRL